MRICRIVNGLPTPSSPGAGIGFYHLAQHITEPCLLLSGTATSYPPLPPHVRLVPLPLQHGSTPADVRRRVFTDRPGRLARGRLQARLLHGLAREHGRSLLIALREMRRFEPDLIICHQLRQLPYGVMAKVLLRRPLVLYLHNTSEVDAARNLPLVRLLLGLPDRVAAVSPEIARRLATIVPAPRIWLTSTGVDTAAFTDWHLPRHRQLVTIGHFKWKKAYPDLLNAVARAFDRLPDQRLVIVGDGEERHRIVEQIARLSLGDRVVLAGVLSRAEVLRVLNESRLFVLASVHEGLPRALLEALACGTPAVVTDACNAEGIIESTGIAVPARQPQALADAMVTVLSDRDLWQRCSREGPSVAARYDWRAVAAHDHALYRSLGASPPGRDGAGGRDRLRPPPR